MVYVGFDVKRWEDGIEGIEETRKYLRRKIGAVLRGEEIDPSEPPPLEVSCTHFSGVSQFLSRGVYPVAHERLVTVRPKPRVHFRRDFVPRSTKQTQARPAVPLEHVLKHIEHILPQHFPVIQPSLFGCSRVLGNTLAETVRTCFGVRVDFGSGAWRFGKYNRGSGEREGQEEHVCGDADGEDGDHEGGEGRRVECEFEPCRGQRQV